MTRNPDTYRARRLRAEANTPEQVAWQALRVLRTLGHPVRRQHPIAGYVADFAIIKARLVIEIDGSVHDVEALRAADAERQAEIERLENELTEVRGKMAATLKELGVGV